MTLENEMEFLEKEVDSFLSSLPIRHYPNNFAQWAIMNKTAIELQRAATKEYGGANHRSKTISLSRVAALLLSEITAKGNHNFAGRKSLQWNAALDDLAVQAITEGYGYFHAWAGFSFWRGGRFKAQVTGRRVSFTSEESSKERQMKAFQKTILKKASRRPPSESLAPMPPQRLALFEKLMTSVGGAKSKTVAYQIPKELSSDLFPWFQSQSAILASYPDEICLGGYSMKEVKQFIAALQTVCAIHDHICFLMALKRNEFPVNSAVLMKTKEDWVTEITRISGINLTATAEILNDLTFGRRVPIDLHSELCVLSARLRD